MNNSVIQKLSILCLLIVCSVVAFFLGSTCALGDDTAGGSTSDSTPDTSATQSQTTITGGVVKIDVALSDLRDARLATHRLRKATADLYDEMTRHEMMMGYNPNVVGSILIMAPAPMAGPILPARKQWVDASMDEIGPIIKLFKQDVEIAIESHRHTDVSDKTREALDPLKDEAFGQVEKSFEIYKQLQTLTGGSMYDQPQVAAVAKSLDQEVKELDKSLKRGISMLQKEQKAEKKAEKKSS